MAKDFTTVINKFLGLHQCEAGESRLKTGESPNMLNLTVTPNHTLLQRDGWETVSDTRGRGRAVCCNGDDIYWVVSDEVWLKNSQGEFLIGYLESESGDVCIFPFDSMVYFLDGKRIMQWDGASFLELIPYVPLIAISCDYLGAGVPFEAVNMLTGKKRQSFTPDGVHSEFQLAEANIDSVDSVTLFGEEVPKRDYEVNLEKGSVTFDSAPSNTDPNSIEIAFTKGNTESDSIHRMRWAIAYGGENDTRVFLWGDGKYPSHIRYSGVHSGMSGMDYFPELNFNRIGSGGRITSVIRHYDGLMLFTESEAFGCRSEVRTDDGGLEYTVYPVRTLSAQVGCGADGFARLVDNKPVTLAHSGLYRWSSSTIRDERNAEEIGERIRLGLGELGVEGVRSFDKATTSELYIWKGNKVYVYNYSTDLFYYYEGFDAAAFDEDGKGVTWFVRCDGRLCRFTDVKSDGGEPIPFRWESGYEEHFGLDTKNVHRLEFEVYPISATGFGFSWVSERLTGRYDTLEVVYNLADFANICFDTFSFSTAVTPVRLHKRIKTKRTRGFKIIIENDGNRGDFHLLSLRVSGRLTDAQ